MNFAFESLSAFFSMGGYSFYVWSAYSISFLILLLLCTQSFRMQKKILNNLKDIGFIKFDDKDVVRNPLVSKIVSKYDKFEKSEGVGKEYLSKEKND